MSILEAIIFGLVQGLTEFIPVSSSGHLILLHKIFGADSGLTFDIALHVGTFLALLIFFNKDVWGYAKAFFVSGPSTRLSRLLAVATLPAVFTGVVLQSAAETVFRSATLVSINLIAVALLMILAERKAKQRSQQTKLTNITQNQALAMGLAQGAAIIPGVSRSGATITAGIFAGLDRVGATRFSFLLAIPITAGAVIKVLLSNEAFGQIGTQPLIFVVGLLSALLSGLFAIRFLISFLGSHSLALFAYYRIGLGLFTLSLLVLG